MDGQLLDHDVGIVEHPEQVAQSGHGAIRGHFDLELLLVYDVPLMSATALWRE